LSRGSNQRSSDRRSELIPLRAQSWIASRTATLCGRGDVALLCSRLTRRCFLAAVARQCQFRFPHLLTRGANTRCRESRGPGDCLRPSASRRTGCRVPVDTAQYRLAAPQRTGDGLVVLRPGARSGERAHLPEHLFKKPLISGMNCSRDLAFDGDSIRVRGLAGIEPRP
jgi:hypothetical protein